MNSTEQALRSFAAWRQPTMDWDDPKQFSKVYVGDPTNGPSPTASVASFPDPYDGIGFLAAAAQNDTCIFEMWGWITPIDPDTNEDNGDKERCVVMVVVHEADAQVGVARKDGTLDVFNDMGEGIFGEALKDAIALARMDKVAANGN